MVPETLPPYRHISSKPISLADASTLLSTYLSNSEAHPHLHPDALITPAGVTFSSHGGPMGGVVMHNLRRVAAGLRGEYLEPEPTPEPEEDPEAQGASSKKGKKRNVETAQEEGWQDMSEYEREEGVVQVGELGDRVAVVQEGGEEPEVEITGEKKKRKESEGNEKLDKAARKKAKQERNKDFKREKERKKAEGTE